MILPSPPRPPPFTAIDVFMLQVASPFNPLAMKLSEVDIDW